MPSGLQTATEAQTGFAVRLFQCLQTPELHNKTLVARKREQQPRLSQLRHRRVPISCKMESLLCALSSKSLPSFILRAGAIHHLGCPHTSTKPSLPLPLAAEPTSPEGPLITTLDREEVGNRPAQRKSYHPQCLSLGSALFGEPVMVIIELRHHQV